MVCISAPLVPLILFRVCTRTYLRPESGGTTEIFRLRFCAEAKPASSWLAGWDDLSIDIIILAGFTFMNIPRSDL